MCSSDLADDAVEAFVTIDLVATIATVVVALGPMLAPLCERVYKEAAAWWRKRRAATDSDAAWARRLAEPTMKFENVTPSSL